MAGLQNARHNAEFDKCSGCGTFGEFKREKGRRRRIEPRDESATGVESADYDALGFLCWPSAGPVGRLVAASTLANRGWISYTAIAFASIRLLHAGVASFFPPIRRSLSPAIINSQKEKGKYYLWVTGSGQLDLYSSSIYIYAFQ